MCDVTLWPATDQQEQTSNWSISDLQHGDLIFCARPGDWVAFLDSIAGEPWRHVGAISRDSDGEWGVLETVGNTFAHRKLNDFVSVYESFGVARLDVNHGYIDQATAWMHEKVASETPHVYAWDDLILAGVIAATHRHLDPSKRDKLRSALAAAASAAKERPEHQGVASLTCSAFIQIAYDTVGGDRTIEHERWRSATSWPPGLGSIDELFDGPRKDFEDATSHSNLLELFALGEVNERSAAGSQAKPGQVWEMMRMMLHAVAGWNGHVDDMTAAIGGDGRWVTPGDLWDSPTVSVRGYLQKQEALDQLGRES